MREMDPYETLGISDTATQAQLRSAASMLVIQCSVARGVGTPEADERLRDVLAAYEILIANEARGLTALMREVYRLKRAALRYQKSASANPLPPPKPATWMDVVQLLSEGRSEAEKFVLGFVAGALDYAAGMSGSE